MKGLCLCNNNFILVNLITAPLNERSYVSGNKFTLAFIFYLSWIPTKALLLWVNVHVITADESHFGCSGVAVWLV